MANVTTLSAALATAAAFAFYSVATVAQAPIVDASDVAASYRAEAVPEVPASAPVNGESQGDLVYQLEMLQQEVRELRGVVEEQANELRQLKQQSLDRYIDMDRRLNQIVPGGAAAGGTGGDDSAAGSTGSAAGGELSAGSAGNDDEAAYRSAYNLVRDRKFPEAVTAFKAFQGSYPDSQYVPNSYYWLGALYMQDPQDLENARQAFSQLIDQYPNHAKVPEAMYKLGQVYYYKGDKKRAKQLLEQVVADYNGTAGAVAGQASKFLADNF